MPEDEVNETSEIEDANGAEVPAPDPAGAQPAD